MIIEYLGLPGSGKTYLAERRVKENQEYTYVAIRTRTERFFYAFVFMGTHPLISFRMIWTVMKRTPLHFRLLKHKTAFLLLGAFAREARASYFTTKDTVLDEGLHQFMLSMYEKPVDERTMQEDWGMIVRNMKHTRQIVFVECKREARMQRMRTRNRFPRRMLSQAYQEHFLGVQEQNYPLVKRLLEEEYSVETVTSNA